MYIHAASQLIELSVYGIMRYGDIGQPAWSRESIRFVPVWYTAK